MVNKDRVPVEGKKIEENNHKQPPASPVANGVVMNEDDPTLLVRHEVRKGSRLGDERIRLVRPRLQSFRRVDTGLLETTDVVQEPHTRAERIRYGLKRFFIGSPIATAGLEHERLTKFKALAVLSSDAISSVAYATEAILFS